jgi:hypothetical protein
MNNKLIVSVVVAAIVFGGGGYYLGKQASASQTPARGAGTFAGRTGGAGGARFAGGGAAFGTIVAKDATSITVQLMTGTSTTSGSGSKIVLYSAGTQIGKMVAGTSADLAVGTNVTVSGTANSDGSITAQSIQIRPAGTNRPGAGQ